VKLLPWFGKHPESGAKVLVERWGEFWNMKTGLFPKNLRKEKEK